MVPLYVKKSWETANIGLFFHSPFPSSSHFVTYRQRFDIIKSLLHCDLVAFHLFIYARHFFKTCSRVGGFDIEFRRGGFLGVNFHGKNVMIRVSHVGIEQPHFDEIMVTQKFKDINIKFQREMHNIKKIIQSSRGSKSALNPIIMSSIAFYH